MCAGKAHMMKDKTEADCIKSCVSRSASYAFADGINGNEAQR